MPDDTNTQTNTTTTTQTQTQQTTPWYNGADAETVGHIQNKGWDKLTPDKAAFEAIKAARGAEKFIGVPPEEILRMPKDEAGWNAFYQKIGVPDKAEGYELKDVKFADGSELDEGFAAFLKTTASNLHLTKENAVRLAAELVKHLDGIEANETAENSAKLAQGKRALQQNWGNNYDTNLFVARKGAEALGVDVETVDKLEGIMGYDKVMEMFRKVGVLGKEDAFVRGTSSTGGGVMTKEQAEAKVKDLKNDKEWVKRYFDGGAKEKEEMQALTTLMVAGQTFDAVRGY